MESHAILLNSVRNEVGFFCLIATVCRVFHAKYCYLVGLENRQSKFNCVKNILSVSMKVYYGLFLFTTLWIGNLHVGNLFPILK
jgi:hypothetical protein